MGHVWTRTYMPASIWITTGMPAQTLKLLTLNTFLQLFPLCIENRGLWLPSECFLPYNDRKVHFDAAPTNTPWYVLKRKTYLHIMHAINPACVRVPKQDEVAPHAPHDAARGRAGHTAELGVGAVTVGALDVAHLGRAAGWGGCRERHPNIIRVQ